MATIIDKYNDPCKSKKRKPHRPCDRYDPCEPHVESLFEVFSNQSIPELGVPAATIAPGASLSIPLTARVYRPGQIRLNGDLNITFPGVQTVDFKILRDGISITNGPQTLISGPSITTSNQSSNLTIVTVDQTVPTGRHTYTLQATNITADTITINFYTFVAKSLTATRGSQQETFTANQQYPLNGQYSLTIQPNTSTSISIPANVLSYGKTKLTTNLGVIGVDLQVSLDIQRNGVSITNGPRQIIGGILGPVNRQFNIEDNTIDQTVNYRNEAVTYSLVISNLSATNVANIGTSSFIANVAPREHFEANQTYATIPPATTLLPGTRQTIIVNAKVAKKGQLIINSNLDLSVNQTTTILLEIKRDNKSITNGPQLFLQLFSPTAPPADRVFLNLNNTQADKEVEPGHHTYAVDIINLSPVPIPLNSFSVNTEF